MLNIPKVKETMAVFLLSMEKKTQTEMSPEIEWNILFISLIQTERGQLMDIMAGMINTSYTGADQDGR